MGISVYGPNNLFVGVTVTNNPDGIEIYNDGSTFLNVTGVHNDYSIILNGSTNMIVANATAANTGTYGFWLDGGDFSLIKNIAISNTGWGFLFTGATNNTIENLTIANVGPYHTSAIEILNSSNFNRFTGLLKLDIEDDGSGYTVCRVANNTNPALVDVTCANNDPSDALRPWGLIQRIPSSGG